MADRAQLGEERLKLIRSFMGEPEGEEEDRSDLQVPVQQAPVQQAPVQQAPVQQAPVQPLDPAPASARPGPSAARPGPVSLARRAPSPHIARVRSLRKLATDLGPFLRHHFKSRWPIAAIFLGVIVGVLIAHVG
jgi:hypothetical protein